MPATSSIFPLLHSLEGLVVVGLTLMCVLFTYQPIGMPTATTLQLFDNSTTLPSSQLSNATFLGPLNASLLHLGSHGSSCVRWQHADYPPQTFDDADEAFEDDRSDKCPLASADSLLFPEHATACWVGVDEPTDPPLFIFPDHEHSFGPNCAWVDEGDPFLNASQTDDCSVNGTQCGGLGGSTSYSNDTTRTVLQILQDLCENAKDTLDGQMVQFLSCVAASTMSRQVTKHHVSGAVGEWGIKIDAWLKQWGKRSKKKRHLGSRRGLLSHRINHQRTQQNNATCSSNTTTTSVANITGHTQQPPLIWSEVVSKAASETTESYAGYFYFQFKVRGGTPTPPQARNPSAAFDNCSVGCSPTHAVAHLIGTEWLKLLCDPLLLAVHFVVVPGLEKLPTLFNAHSRYHVTLKQFMASLGFWKRLISYSYVAVAIVAMSLLNQQTPSILQLLLEHRTAVHIGWAVLVSLLQHQLASKKGGQRQNQGLSRVLFLTINAVVSALIYQNAPRMGYTLVAPVTNALNAVRIIMVHSPFLLTSFTSRLLVTLARCMVEGMGVGATLCVGDAFGKRVTHHVHRVISKAVHHLT